MCFGISYFPISVSFQRLINKASFQLFKELAFVNLLFVKMQNWLGVFAFPLQLFVIVWTFFVQAFISVMLVFGGCNRKIIWLLVYAIHTVRISLEIKS